MVNIVYVNVDYADYETNTFKPVCRNVKLVFAENVEINNKNLEKAFKNQYLNYYIPLFRANGFTFKNAISVSVIKQVNGV